MTAAGWFADSKLVPQEGALSYLCRVAVLIAAHALPPVQVVVPVQMSFEEAGPFLHDREPGVEKILSLGSAICIEMRGDGNCFFTSTAVAVLLWAVCQDRSTALEGVFNRFSEARERSKLSKALSPELQVCSVFSRRWFDL